MTYFEQRILGRWTPCTMPLAPEVNIGQQHNTLAQLQRCYSVDGCFAKGQGNG